ncbi:MAG: hypothetical protein ACOCV2_13600 [Persicimonas sp.]
MGLSDKHIIAIKAEDTYGEDAFDDSEPDASDWLAVFEHPEIQESYQEMGPEEITADGFGGQSRAVGDMTEVAFETYLVGKEDAAGDPPPVLSELFKASNMAETVNTDTDVEYDLTFGADQDEVPSMTVYEAIRDDVSGDWYVRVVTGVRGTWTLTFEDGSDVMLSFEGRGLFSELDETTTSITAPSKGDYSGGKDRIKVQGITFKLDGSDHSITNLEIETGMSVFSNRDLTGDHSTDQVKLHLAQGDRPGGSGTWASGEWSDVHTKARPDDDGNPPKGTLEVEVGDADDTVTIKGDGCVVGAYSKSLEGGNYEFETPLTFLDGLSMTFD